MKSIILNAFEAAIREKIDKAETIEEERAILKEIEGIDFTTVFANALEKGSEIIFQSMKETMYEEVMRFRADEQAFVAHQEQKWYRAFAASEALYVMTLETAESYSEYVQTLDEAERKPYEWRFIALQHIHGRALQEFLEIVTLMRNGFADGAYARWRSMYELSVIAAFIKKYGEAVAKKFYEASATEDRYEWARVSGVIPKRKYFTFTDIERECDINTNDWEKQYVLANRVVHASPQGTFARLSNTGKQSIIPVGRSDYGITTPGEHSAISLVVISTMFFSIFPESDTLAGVKIINKWVDVIREAYFKTHDEVFPDDDKLWDDGSARLSPMQRGCQAPGWKCDKLFRMSTPVNMTGNFSRMRARHWDGKGFQAPRWDSWEIA